MSCVKLAIRIRPFTDQELRSDRDRVRVIDVVDEHTVTITNTKVSVSGAGDSRERVRRYNADYTFDSASSQSLPSYATQEKVFQIIGGEVMSNVSRGCSVCVLAYGQSATGKTFTMFGREAQPGLVPRLCGAFADQQPLIVTVSFLEIYNERVHDLLVGEAVSPNYHSLPRNRGNARKDLRVREHPSKGPYVQNLRRVTVHNVEALLSLVNEGIRRRRTASTRRNPSSSRSHALLEIVTPHATLHLADLAGSEKSGFESPGSSRQKEGANINKSLVALSNVISALVTVGRGRTKFIPYRDSALTWLLKDCFTSANTFIIATVSPSAACYGESASTLRWAERASQLPIKRVVNCEVIVTSRSSIQEQFNKLLTELAKNHINYIPETGKINYDTTYWHIKDNTKQYKDANSSVTIGNIMNRMHPRTGASNSDLTAIPVASGSSDVINTLGNEKLSSAVSKEVEKIFGSSLERTSSGSDLKVVPPLRHKRREYSSQEVLPVDETIDAGQSHSKFTVLPSRSEVQINRLENADKIKIPILHENQRAEIIAAVTERLYTKLKKKEEAAVSRMESIVDKKIVEPLSELKICTNARQRLIELSQRAIRNKRKIGIPAFTQTKKSVIRVKDQGTDVQTDLDSYIVKNDSYIRIYRDVYTETAPITPRCKEIAVGPKFGSMSVSDKSTGTEKKKIIHDNSYTMTDQMIKYDHFTQTSIMPPPRRKKRAHKSAKCCTSNNKGKCSKAEECVLAPVVSINICQTYLDDAETQSSDENLVNKVTRNGKEYVTVTPDLLTNHTEDTSDSSIIEKGCNPKRVQKFEKKYDNVSKDNTPKLSKSLGSSEEFSDEEDYSLPRVIVSSTAQPKYTHMKNIILGRNENIYPYNIVLSPTKEIDHLKKIVTFKDVDVAESISVGSNSCHDFKNVYKCNQQGDNNMSYTSEDIILEKRSDHEIICEKMHSDSTESTRHENNSTVWRNNIEGSKTMNYLKRDYIPVYKNSPRYKTARARYKESFCSDKCLDDDIQDKLYSRNIIDENELTSSNNIFSNNHEDINNKKRLRLSKVNTINSEKNKYDQFEDIEGKIFEACGDLEKSVNKYDDYINNLRSTEECNDENISQRTPTEYLQHLIKLRKEIVKTANVLTDRS